MVTAIVLAAGQSTRMGRANKLLLPFGAGPLIEHIVRTVSASDAGEVVVVVGHEADHVRAALARYPVTFAYNARYAEGMTTSIHAGVQASPPDADGFMICLSDLPLITTDEFNRLLRAFQEANQGEESQIVVPTYQGRRGNPVLFPAFFTPDILNQRGLMGCKGIIKANPDMVLEVNMDTDHVLRDIDTAEDYRQAVGAEIPEAIDPLK